MDHDILNMFKEKNRNILINSLKYDILILNRGIICIQKQFLLQ